MTASDAVDVVRTGVVGGASPGKVARRPGRKPNPQRRGQILAAATAEFAARGFAATRMDDIAVRLGIVRGTLYRYFADKEAIFLAVVSQTMAPHVESLRVMSMTELTTLPRLLRGLVAPMAAIAADMPLGGVLKMVISEAGNFPALARIWHDGLMRPTLDVLAEAIAQAQRRGEARGGDPRLYALQLISPLVTALIWRETFVPSGASGVALEALLAQSVEAFLDGVLIAPDGEALSRGLQREGDAEWSAAARQLLESATRSRRQGAAGEGTASVA
jgi:AcrR family transcriptional regulator